MTSSLKISVRDQDSQPLDSDVQEEADRVNQVQHDFFEIYWVGQNRQIYGKAFKGEQMSRKVSDFMFEEYLFRIKLSSSSQRTTDFLKLSELLDFKMFYFQDF